MGIARHDLAPKSSDVLTRDVSLAEHKIETLLDISLSSPINDDILKYDNSLGKWKK